MTKDIYFLIDQTKHCHLCIEGSFEIALTVPFRSIYNLDTLIAHASLRIPDSVLEKGELSDDWWPLSGQEGDGKEGMLHLILSMQKIQPVS